MNHRHPPGEPLGTDLRRFRRMVDDLLEISAATRTPTLHLRAPRPRRGRARHRPTPRHPAGRARRHRSTVGPRRPPPAGTRGDEPAGQRHRHGRRLVRRGIGAHDGRARIEIDDAGPGVPARARVHIFERFARGSPADRDTTDGGVGLGLAFVDHHVRQHGGHVWGRGTDRGAPVSSSDYRRSPNGPPERRDHGRRAPAHRGVRGQQRANPPPPRQHHRPTTARDTERGHPTTAQHHAADHIRIHIELT